MAFETEAERLHPIEDEIRIPGIDDLDRLLILLEDHGAEPVFVGRVTDHLLDTKTGILKQKYGLKIRARQSVSDSGAEVFELTIKSGIDSKDSSREEKRVRESSPVFFSCFEEAEEAARSFIYKQMKRGTIDLNDERLEIEMRVKDRIQYVLGSVSFEIDRLDSWKKRGKKDIEDLSFVPWYVDLEIKYPHDESLDEVENLYSERVTLMRRFGLHNDQKIPKGTHGMIKYYRSLERARKLEA